jgi:hypothetical protein
VARLLIEHDQMAEAEQALARADQRGHPAAAPNLAALREYRLSTAKPDGAAQATDPGADVEAPAAETVMLAPQAAPPETAAPAPDVAPSGAMTPEPIADDAEAVRDTELRRDERRKGARVGRTAVVRRRRWAAVALGFLVISIAFAISNKFGSTSTKTQPSSIVTDAQADRATATHTASLPATPVPAARNRPAPANRLAHTKTSPSLQAKAKVIKKNVTPARKPRTSTTSQSPTETTVSTQSTPPASGAATPVHWSPPQPITSGSTPSSSGSGVGRSTPKRGSPTGSSGSGSPPSTHAGAGGSPGNGSSNHGGTGRGLSGSTTIGASNGTGAATGGG